MDVYGWVFKLCIRFCVWQLSGKNILFLAFNRSASNAQLFFCQIYVWNGTNKRMQHTELSFLSLAKAIKALSCITDFGISTAIITFFVGGESWTLDTSMEVANCNTKLTKKFILVAVWYSFQQQLHIDWKRTIFHVEVWIIETCSLFKSHLVVQIWTIIYVEYFVNS